MASPPRPPELTKKKSSGALKVSSSGGGASEKELSSANTSHQYYKGPLDLKDEVQYLLEPIIINSSRHQNLVTFVHNVSPVIQRGPMCGIVALSMATELVSLGKGSSAALDHLPWQPKDVHHEALLQFAKDCKLTKQGEMFSADYMARIAEEKLHCYSKVIDINSLSLYDLVVSIISHSEGIIVPYDADKDHSPFLANGHKAHWCLLVGFAIVLSKEESSSLSLVDSCLCDPSHPRHYILKRDCLSSFISKLQTTTMKEQSNDGPEAYSTPSLAVDKDCLYVFTRHGKSRHIGLWSFEQLKRSNLNLVEVGPQRDEDEFVVPVGGILQGLRSKAVIVQYQTPQKQSQK